MFDQTKESYIEGAAKKSKEFVRVARLLMVSRIMTIAILIMAANFIVHAVVSIKKFRG